MAANPGPQLAVDSLNDILKGRNEGPHLSLYQPTHRSHPENQQDPIRFRNLVRSMEESLRRHYAGSDAGALLAPFDALASDERFWNHALDGLAVLAAPGVFRVYRLQRPVDAFAVVTDSFHVKPLLRILQSADRYQVLGLSRQEVRLFEGNRDALDEIDLDPAVPRKLADALEAERKQPHTSVWTYRAGAAGPQAGAGVQHGQGGQKDEEGERDTEKFFRTVDRAVLERHSRPAGLPLLLAALPENQGVFRPLSRNPFLLAEGIDVHPEALSADALRERAWQVLEPHYLARLAGLVEMYGAARSRELGAEDIDEVTDGAAAGRVATVLLKAERDDPETDERLDDIGELALANGGQVVIVPGARMPTRTGVAAIYRF
jgi:hypothetical protein